MSNELVQVDLRSLEEGELFILKGSLSPESLDLDQNETKQFSAVAYNLEGQLFSESLVMKVDLKGEKTISCKICNKEFTTEILIEKAHEIISLDDVAGYKVDLIPTLRNLFLLEDPGVLECNNGSCTDRPEVENFLKRNRLSVNPFGSLS